MATIAVLGTLDTKGREHAFIAKRIAHRGHKVLLIDVGSGAQPQVTPDISRDEVALAGNVNLSAAVASGDRGKCVSAMSNAASTFLKQLHDAGRIDGVISLGGSGGTAIATAAMRALPIGVPKLIVSTMASGDISQYVGTKDITMMPSIVDVAGLNRISKRIFTHAADAICGMCVEEPSQGERSAEAKPSDGDDRDIIVASMFGNTTDCVNHAKAVLEDAGFEVIVFHATGSGGRAMESIIESGMVAGVLDITTTEWADEIVGGVLSAGSDRLLAAARSGVPTIVAPGCLDMANFGAIESIPETYRNRNLYQHNPQVTLMRTSADECEQIGRAIAERLNQYEGPLTFLIPRKAISVISAEGQQFHDPTADERLFTTITSNLRSDIAVLSFERAINDEAFARACADTLLNLIEAKRK